MQVSVAGLRRNIKNIAHNYTEPQKKVREATSNDPWGPSSTLMSEIADLTYNIEAFAQIMEMLWKRLNDHGKNWRHVYKSLVLLEYLIKTGSERVGQQCKENIFAIQTLKDFQYFEDNKDQGMNVREKAKQLVTLLTSEERLRNERARALKARERFAQTVSGFGSSDSNETTPTSPVFGTAFGHGSSGGGGSGDMVSNSNGHHHHHHSSSREQRARDRMNMELEQARPQTLGEEELQLQLALAMSKEEADQEEKRRRSDELKLQMALSQSEQEFRHISTSPPKKDSGGKGSSALVDLLDVDLGGAAGLEAQMMAGSGSSSAAWGGHSNKPTNRGDIWSASTSPHDPWKSNANAKPLLGANNNNVNTNNITGDAWASFAVPPSSSSATKAADPWSIGPTTTTSSSSLIMEDEFDMISKRTEGSSTLNLDPLGPSLLTPTTTTTNMTNRSNSSTPDNLGSGVKRMKDPLEFLGENSNLVNLDNLVPATKTNNLSSPLLQNPFNNPTPPTTSLLSSSSVMMMSSSSASSSSQAPPPPVNPFHLQNAVAKPSINEIREKQAAATNVGFGGGSTSPAARPTNNPWSPVKEHQNQNQFLG